MKHEIKITVNGVLYERSVEPRTSLADFLRHELRLTGTHLGCEHGVCGSCTVLVNGMSARSCLMFAVQADACSILTVEGLSKPGEPLHPLQQAFREQHALQCGFCTPGMLMTALELISEIADPTEELVRETISGNICRCTGYQSIVDATRQAAAALRKERAS